MQADGVYKVNVILRPLLKTGLPQRHGDTEKDEVQKEVKLPVFLLIVALPLSVNSVSLWLSCPFSSSLEPDFQGITNHVEITGT